ncbi:hypothetical protein E5288_WYG017591 [Bos mutus]|uniref:Sulfotransferase n=2 Tax=Bos mutus TaxID=72004 RepID=A0A6B0RS75_9CETA|nr:hypothetical protein [Bos mutus]
MALPVGLLSVSVYWLHSVAGLQHGETVTHLPEVKGGKCFFPFRYRDGIFHDCVQFRVKHKWCSLNETYQGYWKYCSEEVFSNYSCIFPFVYDDIVYYSCVSVRSDYAWCSIDEMFQGRWRYCTAKDPPSCTFPFLYRNKYFFKCTKEGYVLSRSWCSLTRDYNKDGKWKQCSPYQSLSSLPGILDLIQDGSFFKSKAKVIYLIRNPRDVLVSGYFFWRIAKFVKRPQSLEQYFEWFVEGNDFLFFWDTRSTVEKICQFLGKKLEPEELNSVLKNSSFQAMKENNMSNSSLLKGTLINDLGEINDCSMLTIQRISQSNSDYG